MTSNVMTFVGNNWFERNKEEISKKLDHSTDKAIALLKEVNYTPKKVLEIGCANGRRLKLLKEIYNCEIAGLDVSPLAIESGLNDLGLKDVADLQVGAQEDPWPWEKNSFDLVIFGYSLCMGDAFRLFYTAAEADRVLKGDSVLIIQDTIMPRPILSKQLLLTDANTQEKKKYFFLNYDYSKLWLGHPGYKLITETIEAKTMGPNAPIGSAFAITSLLLKVMKFLVIVPPPYKQEEK